MCNWKMYLWILNKILWFSDSKSIKKIFVIASLLVGFVCTAQIKPAAIGVTYGVKTTAKGAIEVPVLEEKNRPP